MNTTKAKIIATNLVSHVEKHLTEEEILELINTMLVDVTFSKRELLDILETVYFSVFSRQHPHSKNSNIEVSG